MVLKLDIQSEAEQPRAVCRVGIDTSTKGELDCMHHLLIAAQKLRLEPVTVEVRRPVVTRSAVAGATMRTGM